MKNVAFISYLRVMATIAVVIIHATGIIAKEGTTITTGINQSMMWSVPAFLMISGYLLLDEIGDKHSYTKRLLRFIIPFVFWNFFYFAFYQLFSDAYSVGERIELFFQNFYSASHLWYLILYLQVILVIGFVNLCFTGQASKQAGLFLLVITISLVQLFFVNHYKVNWLNIFNPFFLIVFLGYVVKIHDTKLHPFISIIIALSLLVIGYLVNTRTSINSFEYLSPLNIGIALFLFIALKNSTIKTNKWVDYVSKCSFGIYLIHFILIEIAHKLNWVNSYNFMLVAIVVFILSLMATLALSKIPYLKRVI